MARASTSPSSGLAAPAAAARSSTWRASAIRRAMRSGVCDRHMERGETVTSNVSTERARGTPSRSTIEKAGVGEATSRTASG